MDQGLRLEWASFLNAQEWDYFLTITFREPLPQYRAERVLDSVYGALKRFKPSMVFLAAEAHVSQLAHFHGLFKGSTPLPELRASELWQRLYDLFGRSKVEIPRSKSDVADYVSKYCVKRTEIYNLYTATAKELQPIRKRKRRSVARGVLR